MTAGNTTIRGFTINGFPGAAIALVGAGGNQVANNLIGTDFTSASLPAARNGGAGVLIAGLSGNTIGTKNVISGNLGAGILITDFAGAGSSDNVVISSAIGTDGSGTYGLPNGGAGIEIDGSALPAANKRIPAALGSGDSIGGNDGPGIWIHGALASGNLVQLHQYWRVLPSALLQHVQRDPQMEVTACTFQYGAHDNAVGCLYAAFCVPLVFDIVAYNHGAGIAMDGVHLPPTPSLPCSRTYNDGLGIDHAPFGNGHACVRWRSYVGHVLSRRLHGIRRRVPLGDGLHPQRPQTRLSNRTCT